MSELENLLKKETLSLSKVLKRKKIPFCFAESCTGGKIASEFTQIPGISEYFCGSLVAYQESAKIRWLKLSSELLASDSSVSPKVAEKMVLGALKATPAAQLAGAVTGYLGPNAPREQNGLYYTAVGIRHLSSKTRAQVLIQENWIHKHDLYQSLYSQELNARQKPQQKRGSHSVSRKQKIRSTQQLLASLSLIRMVRSLL